LQNGGNPICEPQIGTHEPSHGSEMKPPKLATLVQIKLPKVVTSKQAEENPILKAYKH